MEIRFLRPWKQWKIGAEAILADGMANTLIRRKIAEEAAKAPAAKDKKAKR